MIKAVLFKLLEVLVFFKKNNLQIVSTDEYTDGTKVYEYVYGTKRYLSVGAVPKSPPPGIFFPVTATCEGKEVPEFIKFAGPKMNHVPDTGYILFRRVPRLSFKVEHGLEFRLHWARQKGPSKDIIVKNIIGAQSVFGAK